MILYLLISLFFLLDLKEIILKLLEPWNKNNLPYIRDYVEQMQNERLRKLKTIVQFTTVNSLKSNYNPIKSRQIVKISLS